MALDSQKVEKGLINLTLRGLCRGLFTGPFRLVSKKYRDIFSFITCSERDVFMEERRFRTSLRVVSEDAYSHKIRRKR